MATPDDDDDRMTVSRKSYYPCKHIQTQKKKRELQTLTTSYKSSSHLPFKAVRSVSRTSSDRPQCDVEMDDSDHF
jgi:hypothetical protein